MQVDASSATIPSSLDTTYSAPLSSDDDESLILAASNVETSISSPDGVAAEMQPSEKTQVEINDQVNQPSSTFAVAPEVSNANTATSTTTVNATSVPGEVYDRLLTTLSDRIDRLTDEIPIDRIVD